MFFKAKKKKYTVLMELRTPKNIPISLPTRLRAHVAQSPRVYPFPPVSF